MDNERMEISYQMVLAAAKRAKQLTAGAKPRVNKSFPKTTFTALEEIAHDKINFTFFGENED